jgi:hypothetical protein
MFEEELWTLISGNPSELCCNCFFPIIPSTTCLQLGASPSYESCWLYPRSGRFLNKKIFATTLTSESKYLIQHINMCCNLWVGVVCVCVCSVSFQYQQQAWTNGRFKSVRHRAVVNETEARLSIAYFSNPPPLSVMTVPQNLIDSLHPLQFRPSFTWVDYKLHLLEMHKKPNGSKTSKAWLRSTKSLWKLHGFEAPNLYENSMTWEHQISLKTPWLRSTKSLWKLHTAPSYPRRTPN